MEIKGFIFDLDGVLVDTAHFHAECWSEMAEGIGIKLSQSDLDNMRGVGRMDSLEMILRHTNKQYADQEKLKLAELKNQCYLQKVNQLTPGDELPETKTFLEKTREEEIKISLGSSSKNAKLVLSKLEFNELFDAICDGTDITKSKPDPQIFQIACEKLELPAQQCIVFEDAEEGIKAALAAGCCAIGVGPKDSPAFRKAHYVIEGFEGWTPKQLIKNLKQTFS